jgi:hypothetical protein
VKARQESNSTGQAAGIQQRRSWRRVLASFLSILIGFPIAASFYAPTGVGYVQLPGDIIMLAVNCLCIWRFVACPWLPLLPKLLTLLLMIFPIFCALQFSGTYYLHCKYGS